jgi:hypothetical protein
MPDTNPDQWVIKTTKASTPKYFKNRKAATAEAKRQLGDQPGQVSVFYPSGKIQVEVLQGLPRVRSIPAKSKLSVADIQKAVSSVVRANLLSS